MCRLTVGGPFSLYIYAVPTSANATRLIITAASDRRAGKAALPVRIMEALGLTRLFGHWTLNRVTDGGSSPAPLISIRLAHAQGRQNEAEATRCDLPHPPLLCKHLPCLMLGHVHRRHMPEHLTTAA